MFRPSCFRKDEQGTITLLAAFLLPVLIGFLALAAEFGYGLLMQVENQRVADAAAMSAALAYGNGKTTATQYTSAASNIVSLNGMSDATLAVTLTTVPQDSSKQAIKVVLTRTEVLGLAKAISSLVSMPISATSYAQIGQSAASGCVMALKASGQGVNVASGSNITASSCNVVSNASISCSGSSTIAASSKIYVGNITCGTGTKTSSVTDPLALNSGVIAATAELNNLSNLTAPSSPAATGGVSLDFNGSSVSNSTLNTLRSMGCTASFSSSSGAIYTVSCPTGTYNLSGITVTNSQLAWTGTSNSTFNVSGSITINNGSNGVNFNGGGIWNVNSGILNQGPQTTFDTGTYNIGSTSSASCSGTYSICNTSGSSLTFNGSSIFSLAAAIRNHGNKVSLGLIGSSQSNSIKIGSGSDGAAIYLTAGTVTLGDASTFQLFGNVTQVASSCVRFGSATMHDVIGSISINGSMQMYDGTYAISGSFAAPSGGSVGPCNGTTPSSFLTTSNATLAIGGATKVASCSSSIVCLIENGSISMTAPKSGTYQNLAMIVPSSTASGLASLSLGGSTATISGAIYMPNLTFTASGSIKVTSGTCLDIITAEIIVTGSAALTANECFSSSSGGSGSGSIYSTKIVD